MSVAQPDPAAIRLEVLTRMLGGRNAWTRGPAGWCLGPYELVARREPGLPYELWKGKRCVAAMMAPRDAIAVTECLAEAAGQREAAPGTLFGLSVPAQHPSL